MPCANCGSEKTVKDEKFNNVICADCGIVLKDNPSKSYQQLIADETLKIEQEDAKLKAQLFNRLTAREQKCFEFLEQDERFQAYRIPQCLTDHLFNTSVTLAYFHPLTTIAMISLQQIHPEIWEEIKNFTFVIGGNTPIGNYAGAFLTSVINPEGTGKSFEYVTGIYIDEPLVRLHTDEELLALLLHEGYHWLIEKNPQKFSETPFQQLIESMFFLEEDRVEKLVATHGLQNACNTGRAKAGYLYFQSAKRFIPINDTAKEVYRYFHLFLHGKRAWKNESDYHIKERIKND